MPDLTYITGGLATTATALTADMAAKAPDGHCVITWPAGTITLPAAAPDADFTPRGKVWTDVPRTQDFPLMRVSANRRERINITAQLTGYRGVGADRQINLLRSAQSQTAPVTVAWTRITDAHKWLMTDLAIRLERANTNGTQRHATATITLVEWRDEQVTVQSTTKTPTSGKKSVKYTVKKGDTLTSIAVKVCKDASHARQIGVDNKIRDPKKLPKTLTIKC